MNMMQVAENNIQTYQAEYDSNAKSLEAYQDIMDYLNDITDCLGNLYFKKGSD